MKKILLSLLVVAAVGAGMVYGTKAYFTDTEESKGNTFTTGTIDIAVDGQNPWDRELPYELEDMKPSQTDYIDFVVHNVGTNPVNLYKTLTNNVPRDLTTSEPECVAEGGTWVSDGCQNNTPVYGIGAVINYDMRVELYKNEPGVGIDPVWWETIYMDSDNVKLVDLWNEDMYLGMVPAGWWLKVSQSYHMVPEAGNEYQGDSLTFDIVLTGEQLGAHALRLENKDEVQFGGYSHTLLSDGRYADLTYKVRDREFEYSLDVHGMGANQAYTLIQYPDPLDGTDAWANRANSLALANVSTDGSGNGSVLNGSVELNQDLTNAKIWLIPGTYTPGSTVGVAFGWNPTNMLFETGLMDYYDADP